MLVRISALTNTVVVVVVVIEVLLVLRPPLVDVLVVTV